MPAQPDETDLILQLHADAAAGGNWAGLCERLTVLTRARAAVLAAQDLDGATASDVGLAALPTDLAAVIAAPEDPCGLRRMRPGRVHSAADLPGPGLPPAPWQLRAMAVRLAGQAMAWVVIAREHSDFRAADGVLLSALAPHLPQAVAQWRAARQARARAALLGRLVAGLGAAWLGFDADGRVCAHHSGAGTLLQGVARLRPGQRLDLPDPDAAARLERALRRLGSSGGAGAEVVVALGRPPAPALLLARAGPDAADLGAKTLGWLRVPPTMTPDPALAAALLGITPAEARLALTLARGATLREAAAALALTEQTARSYSRQIYARTGLRGQSDLMRALLESPLWLGAQGDTP